MKIFIIHKWRHFYVKYVLKELLKKNKAQDIILLTDDKRQSKEYFWSDIVYENVEDFMVSSNKFKDIYIHKSTNPFNYELFCLQRWLIILEYMEKHGIDDCRHIDSDVLVFCNLEEYAKKYLKNNDFCYVWSCWHTFYWSKKWLNEFKRFMFDTYKNRVNLIESYQKKEWACTYDRNNGCKEKEQSWCFSDMTLIYLFIKEQIEWIKYKDIWIINDWSVFDNNISFWEWFTFWRYFKKLKLWKDKNFYWTLSGKKEKIRFNCLHFQWDAKNLIWFYEGRKLWIKYIMTLYCTKFLIPIIVNISNKLWIKNSLMKMYHKLKAFIFKQSMPLR